MFIWMSGESNRDFVEEIGAPPGVAFEVVRERPAQFFGGGGLDQTRPSPGGA
jgi:hypothetical protein